MLETAGFMKKDEKGKMQCNGADTLYEGINCPEGHYKKSRKDFEAGCEEIGLPCKEGMDCYCSPCVKAFEVDVYPYEDGSDDFHYTNYTGEEVLGCEKMALCGVVEQTKPIKFRAYDNKEREGAEVRAVIHVGDQTEDLEVTRVNNSSMYEFSWTHSMLGVGVMEVYINDEQIPESPIRVQVIKRKCEIEFRGQGKDANSRGQCVCSRGTVDFLGRCNNAAIFFVVIAALLLLFAAGIGSCYLDHKKKQSDQLWHVNVEELHFSDPVEIIGQGSFGVVLMAEYRGTQVAIKRVIAPGEKRNVLTKDGSKDGSSGELAKTATGSIDIESQQSHENGSVDSGSILRSGRNSKDLGAHSSLGLASCSLSTGSTTEDELDFLGGISFGKGKRSKWAKFFPWAFPDNQSRIYASILGSTGGQSTTVSKASFAYWLPWCDKAQQQKQEFINEMRLLSRLRHPCITTIMGAVISHHSEPMLVMEYMQYGSLHDLLRNETMYAGGEIILQILRDVAQGIRFLHTNKPPILHGDLKAKNILIDSRFRAKVSDFGLSGKKKRGISGTPYFMAPEYLRGKTEYNCACDIYSMGIMLYEIYARKDPYQGENPRKVLHDVCNPRKSKRPEIPASCPPKIVDIMKKCWSPDPVYRPQAKDLDTIFFGMNVHEAEPLSQEEQNQRQATRVEKRTKEDMLYELFPRHIADALKAGKKVEPETHEMVTVVFSDIVHFTDISKQLTPMKVSTMLDRLYISFDALSKKHKVFKVETIGDAYMGVTNLDGTQDDGHVKNAAEFAIALVEAASRILIDEDDPKKGFLRIRVGFHSGSVVSNVIGNVNPRYSLFGDTVNIASKMESKSHSRKIQCSDKSAKLLITQAPEIRLAKRGKIAVKGKGDITTFWVENPNIGATEAASPDAYKDFSERHEDPAALDAMTQQHNVLPELTEVDLSA